MLFFKIFFRQLWPLQNTLLTDYLVRHAIDTRVPITDYYDHG